MINAMVLEKMKPTYRNSSRINTKMNYFNIVNIKEYTSQYNL